MSRVTEKYQITIPPSVRKPLGIIPGSEVDISEIRGKYFLVLNPIYELKKKWQGKFKNKQRSNDYINEIRGEVI